MSGTDERLNGLLDGELSPAEALDTARALRDDPALAARLAGLAEVRAAATAIDANLPAPTLPPGLARRSRRRPGMLAGTVALALSAAAAALVLLPAREPPALDSHRRFLLATADAPDGAAGMPDLSAAGLRLARVEAAGRGTYAGYIGPRGCRLGLWIGPRGDAPSAGTAAGAAGGGEAWRSETVARADGQVAWIAAAPAMDAGRFAALAAALRAGPAADTASLATAATHPACLS
ncbi:hypothetical protein D9599_15580 [Roseomonas sp. KE2513]|uniref:hypothetical protein n=1 Tax=Roseomonas sp. KE2513 TaxID=2479202 RepID=UPI0018DFC7C1|nr:hypothetical protein [Roseomonas sp. KE2513]MBI0536991.1 hypothetical protein [Roseomonas sp. KE2513]